jgi:hypothetical protein
MIATYGAVVGTVGLLLALRNEYRVWKKTTDASWTLREGQKKSPPSEDEGMRMERRWSM